MEKNYMFNMSLERFGYLTGRSLSTFNRDFRKVFQTTPQRWLTQKRLELAYYHLKEKRKRPSDVFLEVGFEDLSHFSYAFKRQYGHTPSALIWSIKNSRIKLNIWVIFGHKFHSKIYYYFPNYKNKPDLK